MRGQGNDGTAMNDKWFEGIGRLKKWKCISLVFQYCPGKYVSLASVSLWKDVCLYNYASFAPEALLQQ